MLKITDSKELKIIDDRFNITAYDNKGNYQGVIVKTDLNYYFITQCNTDDWESAHYESIEDIVFENPDLTFKIHYYD